MGSIEVSVTVDKPRVAPGLPSGRETDDPVCTPAAADPRRPPSAIVQTTPDFIVTIDVAGHILSLNPAARQFLGVATDTDDGHLHIADAHPTWANVIVLGEGIETALLDGVWRGETALLNLAGEEIPVSEVILAHRGATGECDYLSIVARDISELVASENTLRQSEQFYRRLVETASAGMWLIDPENRVTFANPALARRLGYTIEELVGQPLAAVMNLNVAPVAGASPRNMPRAADRHEFTLRCKDGSEFPATLSTGPFYDSEERYAGVLAIITEQNGLDSN